MTKSSLRRRFLMESAWLAIANLLWVALPEAALAATVAPPQRPFAVDIVDSALANSLFYEEYKGNRADAGRALAVFAELNAVRPDDPERRLWGSLYQLGAFLQGNVVWPDDTSASGDAIDHPRFGFDGRSGMSQHVVEEAVALDRAKSLPSRVAAQILWTRYFSMPFARRQANGERRFGMWSIAAATRDEIRPRRLHFSTHGSLAEDAPMLSAFLPANGDSLTVLWANIRPGRMTVETAVFTSPSQRSVDFAES